MINRGLLDVRTRLGAAHGDDGEVFVFAPDRHAVADWLKDGVPFGLALGTKRSELEALIDEYGIVFGTEEPPVDPCRADGDLGDHDVNDRFSHVLGVEFDADDGISALRYELRSWTLSDDVILRRQAEEWLIDGEPRPAHDNTRFRELVATALAAVGIQRTRSIGKQGDHERNGVRVSWSQQADESLFARLTLAIEIGG